MAPEWSSRIGGMRNAVECRDCRVSYGPLVVLDGIRFSLRERGTLCLVGPNGGGKTTLLKLLLGFVKPESGTVRVLGGPPAAARRRIGYMPQQLALDPQFPIDVEGIVRMGRLGNRGFGWYSREDRLAAQRALDEVGLLDRRKELFGQLSGGMKQRVLIARALVNDPELLLLDEPTAMVDAHAEAQLLQKLKSLHERMTIILVSHDAAFVSGLVDEVLCINRTAERHPLQRVEDPALQQVYGPGVQAVLHQYTEGKCHGHGSS